MKAYPFILVSPSTRGLSLAITRYLLRTTDLPVFATHRSNKPQEVHKEILTPLRNSNIDPSRLKLLHLELTSEDSIASAVQQLSEALPKDSDVRPHIHTAFFTGGILHPEKKPADLDAGVMHETFQINVISHMLLIKHFSRFLPPTRSASSSSSSSSAETPHAKWVHISARVGSIADNHLGGWYSYRASKSALNQVIRTFDLHLQAQRIPAICVGIHPGTVKTGLSKDFWGGVPEGKLFEPEDAAERVVEVVRCMRDTHRGSVWDWKGEKVPP